MKVVSVRCLHHLKLINEEGSDSQVLMPFKLTNEQGSDSTVQAVMLCIAKVKTSGSGECNGDHSKSKIQTGRRQIRVSVDTGNSMNHRFLIGQSRPL